MGADHNFSTRGDAEVEQKLCNTAGQIAARLSVDDRRDPAKTELMLNYDKAKKEAVWTEWSEDLLMKRMGDKPVTFPPGGEEIVRICACRA